MFDSLSNMWDGLSSAFGQITEIFADLVSALFSFNTLLTDNIEIIIDMTEDLAVGSIGGGIAWYQFIATFHWLVGSTIYYLFYAFIIFGLSVTVFQIIYMIYNHIPIQSIIGGIKGFFFS